MSDIDDMTPEQEAPVQAAVPRVHYGLVRDASGLPCVDDLRLMPRSVWDNELTDDDRDYLIVIHGEENIPTGE